MVYRLRACRVHVCMGSQAWIVTVFKVHMFPYVGGVSLDLRCVKMGLYELVTVAVSAAP